MTDELQAGIDTYKTKNMILAMEKFNRIIQDDPKNEQAWLWLVACQETAYDKIECLKKAAVNLPDSSDIRFALAKLEYQSNKQQLDPKNKFKSNKDNLQHNEKKSVLVKIFSVILKILLYALIIFGGIVLLYFALIFIASRSANSSSPIAGFLTFFMGMGAFFFILIIGIRVALGAWAASIMKSKGRSEVIGWIMGGLLGLIGVIIAACLTADEKELSVQKLETGETKICLACRMVIDAQASICSYCRTQQK